MCASLQVIYWSSYTPRTKNRRFCAAEMAQTSPFQGVYLHHVARETSDVQRMVEFYEQVWSMNYISIVYFLQLVCSAEKKFESGTLNCLFLVKSKSCLNQFHRFLDSRTWEHLNLLEISTLFGCICRHRTRCTLLSEMITHGCRKVLLWCPRMPSKHRTYPREPGPPMIEQNFLGKENVNAMLICQNALLQGWSKRLVARTSSFI